MAAIANASHVSSGVGMLCNVKIRCTIFPICAFLALPEPQIVCLIVTGLYDATERLKSAEVRSITPRAWPTAMAVFALVAKKRSSTLTTSGLYCLMMAVNSSKSCFNRCSGETSLAVVMHPKCKAVSIPDCSAMMAHPILAIPGSTPNIRIIYVVYLSFIVL